MSKTNVTVIPATLDFHKKVALHDPTAKRRVAAYARVSTDKEEQETSFHAQVEYYTQFIAEREDWEMVEVFTDEGISALNTKKRDGFRRMIAEALAGKIDLIVTKSVSRFARNTVDSLNTIRQLKEKGVECFFQKENIWTFDGKGELLLTIMSSLAQEESRSISQNVTWGQRKRFADGKVSMPYGQFLGYAKGEDGKPKVVESEAKVVREIYQLYLNGMTIRRICGALTERGIPTPGGKEKWSVSTVKSILTNERYKGEALLQKRFTVDFLSKKMKKNEGEVPQYYVENSHPAIISPEMFDLVQAEMAKHSQEGVGRRGFSCFSGKLICPFCGEVYGRKTWRTTKDGEAAKRQVWQCCGKYRERGKVCPSIHVTEDAVEAAFVAAFNRVVGNRERYIAALQPILDALNDTTALDSEEGVLRERSAGLYTQLDALVNDNARQLLEPAAYKDRFSELNGRYEAVNARLAEVATLRKSRQVRQESIQRFIQSVREREHLLVGFDEPLWRAVVESAVVHGKEDIAFRFRDGQEVRIGGAHGE